MRRGLIEWSKTELPESVFDSRIAAMRTAMAASNIDTLVAYTNFTRWFGLDSIRSNPPQVARPRSKRPRLEETGRPQPFIDAYSIHESGLYPSGESGIRLGLPDVQMFRVA